MNNDPSLVKLKQPWDNIKQFRMIYLECRSAIVLNREKEQELRQKSSCQNNKQNETTKNNLTNVSKYCK